MVPDHLYVRRQFHRRPVQGGKSRRNLVSFTSSGQYMSLIWQVNGQKGPTLTSWKALIQAELDILRSINWFLLPVLVYRKYSTLKEWPCPALVHPNCACKPTDPWKTHTFLCSRQIVYAFACSVYCYFLLQGQRKVEIIYWTLCFPCGCEW